jgi:hypothetical protein
MRDVKIDDWSEEVTPFWWVGKVTGMNQAQHACSQAWSTRLAWPPELTTAAVILH